MRLGAGTFSHNPNSQNTQSQKAQQSHCFLTTMYAGLEEQSIQKTLILFAGFTSIAPAAQCFPCRDTDDDVVGICITIKITLTSDLCSAGLSRYKLIGFSWPGFMPGSPLMLYICKENVIKCNDLLYHVIYSRQREAQRMGKGILEK